MAGESPSSGGDTVRGGPRGERAIAALGHGVRRLGRWAVQFAGESVRAWRYLDFEQRVAGIGSLLLIVSTFGPFSFVEAAIVLVALAVLLLLKKRADGRSFHLPFGDGAVIMAAGAWSAVLIVIRLLDRPLGQNLLALVCASILVLAGLRMRLRRPMDDLPQERERERTGHEGEVFTRTGGADAGEVEIEFASDTAETAALTRSEDATEALPAPAKPRPPAPSPPTAVRPSTPVAKAPPSPPPSDPDFDLPEPAPPPTEDAAEPGPFRTRPADPE